MASTPSFCRLSTKISAPHFFTVGYLLRPFIPWVDANLLRSSAGLASAIGTTRLGFWWEAP
jgi:hypothetical protein